MAGQRLALALTISLAAALPAAACISDTGFDVPGLRADTPLVLAAPDGRRFRLVALSGESVVAAEGPMRVVSLGVTDRHGRVPAQVFGPAGPIEVALLREGRARLTPTRLVPRDCWRLFERAETEAIRARRGLWAGEGAPIGAADAEALARAEGRFAIAEGRVRSARTQGRITYINFGAPNSGALTVTISDRDMAAFRDNGLEPAAIRGHMLRVRGIVTIRRGPSIAAAIPEAITIAEPPSGGAR